MLLVSFYAIWKDKKTGFHGGGGGGGGVIEINHCH